MLCEKCKKAEAVTHIRQNINGELTEMHLCENCAAEITGSFESQYGKLFSDFGFGLDSMLGSIFGQDFLSENLLSKPEEKCKMCGSTLSAIRKSGNVGCSECYRTFRSELMPLIQRIHGKTVHSGKIPESAEGEISLKNRIAELEKELKKAVDEQNFEKAAEIRDEIAGLKNSL